MDLSILSIPMSIFLGFIQGVAEFLPISSSGHLSLLQNFFKMEHEFGLFNVLLHLGTLISVFIVYWKDIVELVKEFFFGIKAIATKDPAPIPPMRRLVLLLIVATLPLVVVLPIKDYLETLNHNVKFISCALIITGLLLFLSDRIAKGRKTERTATVKDAALIGCAQAIATVPGLSRSGTTISAALLLGFDREFAVRFSFLLSIPAVLGANLLELISVLKNGGFDAEMIPMYLVGIVVSAVVGFFAIHLVKLLSKKGKFGIFAYYCWIVGGISLIAAFILKI